MNASCTRIFWKKKEFVQPACQRLVQAIRVTTGNIKPGDSNLSAHHAQLEPAGGHSLHVG